MSAAEERNHLRGEQMARLDPDEQRLVDDVAEYGWHGIVVDEDQDGPGFMYSVGFQSTLDHPEVIIFGLPSEVMHGVLWNIYRDIEGGRRFEDAAMYTGIFERFACAMREVDETQHPLYLGYAMWHRRHVGQIGELRAMQCFWTDREGRLPWDDGCEAAIAALQPRLDLPADPGRLDQLFRETRPSGETMAVIDGRRIRDRDSLRAVIDEALAEVHADTIITLRIEHAAVLKATCPEIHDELVEKAAALDREDAGLRVVLVDGSNDDC